MQIMIFELAALCALANDMGNVINQQIILVLHIYCSLGRRVNVQVQELPSLWGGGGVYKECVIMIEGIIQASIKDMILSEVRISGFVRGSCLTWMCSSPSWPLKVEALEVNLLICLRVRGRVSRSGWPNCARDKVGQTDQATSPLTSTSIKQRG